MAAMVIATDGGVLERPVHSLHLPMLDPVRCAGMVEGMDQPDPRCALGGPMGFLQRPRSPRWPGCGRRPPVPLSVGTVWMRYGTAAAGACRTSAAIRRMARSCRCAKANLEVRSLLGPAGPVRPGDRISRLRTADGDEQVETEKWSHPQGDCRETLVLPLLLWFDPGEVDGRRRWCARRWVR
jgi:hypothetical protein